MLATLQILPLRADGLVVLHLRHGLGIAETIALELLDEVVEDEGVGTLLAILGQHTNQQEVDGIGLVPLQDAQQLPPSEGEETTIVGLLQSARERGEGDAKANHLVAIHHSGDEVGIGNLDIVVDKFVYLTV